MSFTEKIIEITVTLGTGNFGSDVGDTVTLRGFRSMVDVIHPGGQSMGMANIRVFGMPLELMNKLATIGVINNAIRSKNTVSIAAGDDETGLQLVFFGVIDAAFGDYNAAPDVAFNIMAYAGYDVAVKPVNATSVKGPVSASVLMKGFADAAGLKFEDAGVNVTLTNPYFPGTVLNQIRLCAAAAGIKYTIDRNVLSIWTSKTAVQGEIPTISKNSGMVGYPTLSSKGMDVEMVFNWNMRLGGMVEIQSFIEMANGKWVVFSVSHSLSCKVPDGPWFTYISCAKLNG
jgi:hypothetical protein